LNKDLVFVYGTLRQGGFRAMSDLFPGAKFIGKASIRGSLYDFGSYPGLLLDESSSLVIGEVYEVDDEILNKLDAIEAPAHYRRRRVEVSLGNQRKTCWVYEPDARFYPERKSIASGDWIEHARTKTDWP
jgi:gamma-glutamylcyclotransferase (GGCT)/AIG2-like uncharacterized protein YtfP